MKNDKVIIKSSLRKLLVEMLKSKYSEVILFEQFLIEESFENIVDRFPAVGKGALYKIFYQHQLSLDEVYKSARMKASRETDLPLETFPEKCEWTKEQLTDIDFIYDFINKYCR